ncbi:hypothetical protein [Nostoc sp.]|uniref:hypothetical protein n=1 Tax=Nostoc sp. TaxID=1180 RepID=UPI002FFBEECF
MSKGAGQCNKGAGQCNKGAGRCNKGAGQETCVYNTVALLREGLLLRSHAGITTNYTGHDYE